MAQRTYAPQLARMLQRVVRYDSKHHAKIVATCTAAQAADLATILGAINSTWTAVPTIEQP